MRHLVILTLTAVLSLCSVYAKDSKVQETNESADPTLELVRFAGNIRQFNSLFPQEKVYLQFDNTSYYTGETIWFKAFVVNASTLNEAQSKVLYVDLVSPTGELLKQQKLKVEAGQADGSFVLKDASTGQARGMRGILNYPSGFYEIRAYTNYMLNFSDELVFSRVFAVYEKPRQEGNYYKEDPTIKKHKRESWEIRPQTEKSNKINCTFYPEGGHIVMGKLCRVAFKVTDDTGFGVEATGVLNGNGQTFSTIHDGMGCFTFIPQDNRNTIEITVGNNTRTFELPRTEKAGCLLSVNPCGPDSIKLKVDCVGLADSCVGMTLTCRGELLEFCTFDVNNPVEKTIPMGGVPEGVCRIHIFGSSGNIYASRSIYHHSRDFKAPVLVAAADKPSYHPFEKVTLRFNLEDGQGNPFQNSFCLSVRDALGRVNSCTDDLRTSLLLSSDLKGLIENPSWYFESDAPERDEALDVLMLVQGWERYDWNTMTGQQDFSAVHHVEESLMMNGWVLNSSGKKRLQGIRIKALLAMQMGDERISRKYSCVTDSSGYFSIDLEPEFYGMATFAINAQARRRIIGTDARIKFERSAKPVVRPYLQQELVFRNRLGRSVKSYELEQPDTDEQFPEVIKADDGILLPDVVILEKRKYIDYFTFTAYNVKVDTEIEMDKGEYSTDMMGYLSDRGYSYVITPDDGLIDAASIMAEFDAARSDGVIYEGVLVNGHKPFFYIHDSNKFYYAGSSANPDTRYLKSILVYDHLVSLADIFKECTLMPQYMKDPSTSPFIEIKNYAREVQRDLGERYLLIDIQVKDRKEIGKMLYDEYNINKRITTVDGYSVPYAFYSPEYPDGPVLGDVDYRRTLYWNPNVETDSTGTAQVEFYNNSYSTMFNISGSGITASGIPFVLNENW